MLVLQGLKTSYLHTVAHTTVAAVGTKKTVHAFTGHPPCRGRRLTCSGTHWEWSWTTMQAKLWQ